jgi:hypothetical protein
MSILFLAAEVKEAGVRQPAIEACIEENPICILSVPLSRYRDEMKI